MLRVEAVRSMLFDGVAGLRLEPRAGDTPEVGLARARRRAIAVAAIDWVAILALFLLRDSGADFLAPGSTERGLFTLGILAVATHSGFRLGQLEKYAAVARTLDQLPEASARSREAASDS